MGFSKWRAHSLNVEAYREFLRLNKSWIEVKKYAKGMAIKEKGRHFKNYRSAFFIIYCHIHGEFFQKLVSMSGGASMLYLFSGFYADYEQGYFIGDFAKISKKIGAVERSIYNWFNELQDLDLIFIKKIDGRKYIFISPYDSDIHYQNNDDLDTLKQKYSMWIQDKKKKIDGRVEPFFLIHRKFMDYWSENEYGPKLSGGSIKLYIYCGIMMKKNSGFFQKSLNTIARHLKVSRKTIYNWFIGLEKNQLIERFQTVKDKSSCTYVIPSVRNYDMEKYGRIMDKVSKSKYVGNKNTMKFHLKDECGYVEKIAKLSKEYFYTEKEAIDKGYKACKYCMLLDRTL